MKLVKEEDCLILGRCILIVPLGLSLLCIVLSDYFV